MHQLLSVAAFLPTIFPLTLAVPQHLPSAWANLVYEQNGGTVQWIGPDPSHISTGLEVMTANGAVVTTTYDTKLRLQSDHARTLTLCRTALDIEVQATNTPGSDGSSSEQVLLSPGLVNELTATIQQSCGPSSRKRDLFFPTQKFECVKGLRDPLKDILVNEPQLGSVSLDQAYAIVDKLTLLYSISGNIPNEASLVLRILFILWLT